MAHILGYEDFSSYALEDKMAKNTHVVSQFLDNIRTRLTPKAQKELEYLKNLKAEECKARNIPNDGEYISGITGTTEDFSQRQNTRSMSSRFQNTLLSRARWVAC